MNKHTDLVVVIDGHYSWFQVLHWYFLHKLRADRLLILFQLEWKRVYIMIMEIFVFYWALRSNNALKSTKKLKFVSS